jgi:hypothetical protein
LVELFFCLIFVSSIKNNNKMTKEFVQSVVSKYEREFNLLETMKVLKANIFTYFSWGVSKVANFENKAMILKVNAHRHKAYVVITLAWDDTYSVYLMKTNGEVKKEFKDVYFDQLVEIIDNEIERIPEYKD